MAMEDLLESIQSFDVEQLNDVNNVGSWPLPIKIIIWVLLGAMIVAINRLPKLAQDLWWSTLVLGVIALIMVVLKPF